MGVERALTLVKAEGFSKEMVLFDYVGRTHGCCVKMKPSVAEIGVTMTKLGEVMPVLSRFNIAGLLGSPSRNVYRLQGTVPDLAEETDEAEG